VALGISILLHEVFLVCRFSLEVSILYTCFFFFSFVSVADQTRVSGILGKCPTTEHICI
jgi:hypothetical protein